MNKLIISILLFLLGNILIWFQTNGQFLWKWFEKHPISLSFILEGLYLIVLFSLHDTHINTLII